MDTSNVYAEVRIGDPRVAGYVADRRVEKTASVKTLRKRQSTGGEGKGSRHEPVEDSDRDEAVPNGVSQLAAPSKASSKSRQHSAAKLGRNSPPSHITRPDDAVVVPVPEGGVSLYGGGVVVGVRRVVAGRLGQQHGWQMCSGWG